MTKNCFAVGKSWESEHRVGSGDLKNEKSSSLYVKINKVISKVDRECYKQLI